jgi:predicted XRE-type DNA-binding protein
LTKTKDSNEGFTTQVNHHHAHHRDSDCDGIATHLRTEIQLWREITEQIPQQQFLQPREVQHLQPVTQNNASIRAIFVAVEVDRFQQDNGAIRGPEEQNRATDQW